MLLAALFGSVQRYLRYRALLSGIETLDDRLLYDIGLNRGELSAAAWAQVERTRGGRCVVRRRLSTGAQREISAVQRRRAAPVQGSMPRQGDGGRRAL